MKPEKKNRNEASLFNNLKNGIKNLFGMSSDDVKVVYNSDKPAQLQAHTFAQGTDIHIGGGQEEHLPHETWHVVQQKQVQIKPTIQLKGKVNVNNDLGLKEESDVMGAKVVESTIIMQELSSVQIYNDYGNLDPNHPFCPFGPLATKGSSFIFGSKEWLDKCIIEITVQIFWEKDIPNDFASYYAAYLRDFKNSSFMVDISVLKDGEWKLLNDKPHRLFEENNTNVSRISKFSLNFENNLVFVGPEEKSNPLVFNEERRDGFIKMELVMPEDGFGSNLYPDTVANAVLKQVDWIRQNPLENLNRPSMPSLPYTPLVDEIRISITYVNPSEQEN